MNMSKSVVSAQVAVSCRSGETGPPSVFHQCEEHLRRFSRGFSPDAVSCVISTRPTLCF